MKRFFIIIFSLGIFFSCEPSKSRAIQKDIKDSKEDTEELIKESADEIDDEEVDIEEGPVEK